MRISIALPILVGALLCSSFAVAGGTTAIPTVAIGIFVSNDHLISVEGQVSERTRREWKHKAPGSSIEQPHRLQMRLAGFLPRGGRGRLWAPT